MCLSFVFHFTVNLDCADSPGINERLKGEDDLISLSRDGRACFSAEGFVLRPPATSTFVVWPLTGHGEIIGCESFFSY